MSSSASTKSCSARWPCARLYSAFTLPGSASSTCRRSIPLLLPQSLPAACEVFLHQVRGGQEGGLLVHSVLFMPPVLYTRVPYLLRDYWVAGPATFCPGEK